MCSHLGVMSLAFKVHTVKLGEKSVQSRILIEREALDVCIENLLRIQNRT